MSFAFANEIASSLSLDDPIQRCAPEGPGRPRVVGAEGLAAVAGADDADSGCPGRACDFVSSCFFCCPATWLSCASASFRVADSEGSADLDLGSSSEVLEGPLLLDSSTEVGSTTVGHLAPRGQVDSPRRIANSSARVNHKS